MNNDSAQQYLAQLDKQIAEMVIGALRNTLAQQFSRVEMLEKTVADLTAKLNNPAEPPAPAAEPQK